MSERHSLRIESIAAGGAGVAHHGGRAIFVPRTAPGDLVDVAVEPRAGALHGRALRLLERGPGRVDPPCRFVEACGGCDLMHLSAEAQRGARLSIVKDALRRTAGLADVPPIVLHTLDGPAHEGASLRYRTRARLHARAERGRVKVGFRGAASHDLVVIDRCEVLVPALDALLPELPGVLAGASGDGEISIALGHGGRPVIDVAWSGSIAAATWARLDERTASGAWAGARVLQSGARAPAVFGDPRPVVRGADDQPLVVAPGGFAQPSDEASILLARRAASLVQKGGASIGPVVELYAGSGTLSVLLAPLAPRFVAVESHEESARAARQNLEARGLSAKVVRADAGEYDLARARTVVLDPPRTGARDAVARIAASPARHVVYVACEPTTLARDLAVLTAAGFSVTDVEVADIFPQTAHVETLVRLSRHRAAPIT